MGRKKRRARTRKLAELGEAPSAENRKIRTVSKNQSGTKAYTVRQGRAYYARASRAELDGMCAGGAVTST